MLPNRTLAVPIALRIGAQYALLTHGSIADIVDHLCVHKFISSARGIYSPTPAEIVASHSRRDVLVLLKIASHTLAGAQAAAYRIGYKCSRVGTVNLLMHLDDMSAWEAAINYRVLTPGQLERLVHAGLMGVPNTKTLRIPEFLQTYNMTETHPTCAPFLQIARRYELWWTKTQAPYTIENKQMLRLLLLIENRDSLRLTPALPVHEMWWCICLFVIGSSLPY